MLINPAIQFAYYKDMLKLGIIAWLDHSLIIWLHKAFEVIGHPMTQAD